MLSKEIWVYYVLSLLGCMEAGRGLICVCCGQST